MIVACIGSRDLRNDQLKKCEKIGLIIAEAMKSSITTGNARGADQAFARGVNKFAPERVHLFLPWKGYEEHAINEYNKVTVFNENIPAHQEWMKIAEEIHPAWGRLSNGVRLLMARNIGIVEGADVVIAFPLENKYGRLGGTGQGIRFAKQKKMPILRMDKPVPYSLLLPTE